MFCGIHWPLATIFETTCADDDEAMDDELWKPDGEEDVVKVKVVVVVKG